MSRKSVLEERDRKDRRRERVQERSRAFENRQRDIERRNMRMNPSQSAMGQMPVSTSGLYGETFSVSYKGDKVKKKRGFLKTLLKIFISLILIVAVAVGLMYALFRFFVFGKTNYQSGTSYTITDLVDDADKVTLEGDEAEKVVTIQKKALDELADELARDTGTYNVLLIGADRRDNTWYGNSDVMILATINYERETIYLTSFMRDLYADIPDVGIRKLNASCAYGGANLCVEAIKQNYGVQIDNYAYVDFNGLIGIIDTFGGIDLEITEEEIPTTNGLAKTMAEANGEDPSLHQVTSAGLVHLDGYTATGYARNRSAGGTSDFGRTARQRKVLNALFKKAQKSDIATLTEVIQTALPYVSHNINQTTIFSLMTKVPTLLKFKMEEVRVPFDNEYTISNEILIPTDIGATITKIRNTIY